MKKSICILIGLVTLLSCTTDAYKHGLVIGEKLCNLRSEQDYDKLPNIINEYNSTEDSISAIDFNRVSDYTNGVFDAVKNENDTIIIAAHIIVDSPVDNGLWLARECVDNILNKKEEPIATAANKIDIIHFLYDKTGEQKSNIEFDKAFQSHIDSLSLDKQMLIYTRIASPITLAHAIVDDIEEGKDRKLHIEEIKKIYGAGTTEQAQFLETLKNSLPVSK